MYAYKSAAAGARSPQQAMAYAARLVESQCLDGDAADALYQAAAACGAADVKKAAANQALNAAKAQEEAAKMRWSRA